MSAATRRSAPGDFFTLQVTAPLGTAPHPGRWIVRAAAHNLDGAPGFADDAGRVNDQDLLPAGIPENLVGREVQRAQPPEMAHLRVTKQALHRPLQQLIAGGWIAARAAPGDRRQRLVRLTDSGYALEDRLSGAQRDRFAAAFAEAGPDAERARRNLMTYLEASGVNAPEGGAE